MKTLIKLISVIVIIFLMLCVADVNAHNDIHDKDFQQFASWNIIAKLPV